MHVIWKSTCWPLGAFLGPFKTTFFGCNLGNLHVDRRERFLYQVKTISGEGQFGNLHFDRRGFLLSQVNNTSGTGKLEILILTAGRSFLVRSTNYPLQVSWESKF